MLIKEKNNKKIKQNQKEKFNVYFQNQGWNLLCGLHSVNNFLGSERFTAEMMNEICYTLGEGKNFRNPHKHWLFDGDYDINVLMAALQQEKCQTKWHDKRKSFTKQQLKEADGLLVNIVVPSTLSKLCGCFCCSSGRHWLCIKKIQNNQYAFLDSSKNSYQIKQQDEVLAYIRTIEEQQGQVIILTYEHKKSSPMTAQNTETIKTNIQPHKSSENMIKKQ